MNVALSFSLAVLFLAGCTSASGRVTDTMRPFVPSTDRQLYRELGDFPSPGPNTSSDIKDLQGNVVALPSKGLSSYADKVIDYQVGSPRPVPEGEGAEEALGPPDYTADIWQPPRAVTLGNGGSISLRLSNAGLADVDGPDLFIFEIGPSKEGMLVDISADAKTWITVGEAAGGSCSIDIGPHVEPGETFRYVRIRDISNQGGESEAWPGADIDAVGALGSVERVALPNEVLFEFDSADLAAGAPEVLDRLVESIRRRDRTRITIAGHTDDAGADEYNQKLSERRAEAVAAYLASKGIARDRVETRGYGESKPIVANDGDESRRKNRRVEILIQRR